MTAADDRLELAGLAAGYALAVDTRDEARLLSVFHPDAVLELSPEMIRPGGPSEFRGHDELRKIIGGVGRYARTRHAIFQQVAEINGDHATALTYCDAHHITERDGEWRDHVMVMRYQDTFARTDDSWLFTRRVLSVDWTHDVLVAGVHPYQEA